MFLIIVSVKLTPDSHLFLTVQARRPESTTFGAGQGWQQHACQNGDNCDYHQELNQCEATPSVHAHTDTDNTKLFQYFVLFCAATPSVRHLENVNTFKLRLF